MQLSEYKSRLGKQGWEQFAKDVDCNTAYLSQLATWANKVFEGKKVDPKKFRPVSPELCLVIEKVTTKRDASAKDYPGVVFRWDLRPDFWTKPCKKCIKAMGA